MLKIIVLYYSGARESIKAIAQLQWLMMNDLKNLQKMLLLSWLFSVVSFAGRMGCRAHRLGLRLQSDLKRTRSVLFGHHHRFNKRGRH